MAIKDSNQQAISVPPSDRQKLEKGNREEIEFTVDMLHNYSCFKQVWTPAQEIDEVVEDLPLEVSESSDYKRMITDRGEMCFFYPYRQRMSLDAAAELERREADRREAKRDRALTRKAFWVAFAALFISIVAMLANIFWDAWKYFHPR